MNRVFGVLVLPLLLSSVAVADVLASVDSEQLTWEDFLEIVGGPEVISSFRISSSDEALDLLDSWVQERLVLTAAKESGIESRPDVAAQIESAVSQVLVQAYLEDILGDVEVSRLEAENYVDVWNETYETEYELRQIVLPDSVIAHSVLSRLDSGESFASLAQQYSLDQSAANGGNIGWVRRGMLPLSFMETVGSLSVGGFSPVIHSALGYHVLQLLDKRPLAPPLSDDQKIELATAELVSDKQEKMLHELIENLRSSHEVKIWPERLLNHT